MSSSTARATPTLYGPTAGDRIRLADTDLLIEVERGPLRRPARRRRGRLRRRQGDPRVDGPVAGPPAPRARRTLVITGAVVLDHWGVVKADVGIRDGRIVALGKAGNPDTMDGVHPDLVIGPATEIIAGNGKILTAGAIDSHVHLICPQIVDEALAGGVTTLIGGGTGPAEGTKATTVTPGAWHLARMLEAMDAWPVNVLLLGKGNTVSRGGDVGAAARRRGRVQAARGLGHDARPRSTPACASPTRPACRSRIHTDTLNEAGFVEDTLRGDRRPVDPRVPHRGRRRRARAGHHHRRRRTRTCCRRRPTRPGRTRVNTLDEHLDMLMVCHHLNPAVPEDLAFAESRIRPSTMAAEDVLHDLGAISMIGSDSQAMGRVGEVVLRTWQTAHVMKAAAARCPATARADNLRARRYVAKYTICPAVAHGIDGEVGSVEAGQARRPGAVGPGVLRRTPARWSSRAAMIAWAQMGDANASIPTPQPVLPRPMFGAYGRGAGARRRVALRRAGRDRRRARRPARRATGGSSPVGRRPRAWARPTCRRTTRCPRIEVEPDTFTVRIDGEVVEPDPVDRAADGPALLPLLMTMASPRCSLLADGRLPGRRPRALRRRWRRRSRPGGSPTSATLAAFLRGPAGHRRAGRGRRSPPRPARADADRAGALDAEARRPHARRRRCARRPGGRAAALLRAGRRGLAVGRLRRAAARGRTIRSRSASPRRPAGLAPARRRAGRRVRRGQRAGDAPPCGCSASTRYAVARAARPAGAARCDAVAAEAAAPRRRPGRRPARRRRAAARPRAPSATPPGRCVSLRPDDDHGRRPPRIRPAATRTRRCRPPARALRIGIGGPVGSRQDRAGRGAVPRARPASCALAVVTNDIYTTEDADFLRRDGVLPAERIRAVRDRLLPAHRDPRRHLRQPRRGRGPGGRASARSTWCWSRAAATTSPPRSARAWSTGRSSWSTWPAATRCRARAGPASPPPTCWSSTRPTSRRWSAPTWR